MLVISSVLKSHSTGSGFWKRRSLTLSTFSHYCPTMSVPLTREPWLVIRVVSVIKSLPLAGSLLTSEPSVGSVYSLVIQRGSEHKRTIRRSVYWLLGLAQSVSSTHFFRLFRCQYKFELQSQHVHRHGVRNAIEVTRSKNSRNSLTYSDRSHGSWLFPSLQHRFHLLPG